MMQVLASELADTHERIAEIRAWPDSARKAAILEDWEAKAEEIEAAIAAMAEQDEVMSRALEVAIEQAQATGRIAVSHAPSLGREMQRLAPGCKSTWQNIDMWCVDMDGGQIRLTHRKGDVRGVMSWRMR